MAVALGLLIDDRGHVCWNTRGSRRFFYSGCETDTLLCKMPGSYQIQINTLYQEIDQVLSDACLAYILMIGARGTRFWIYGAVALADANNTLLHT
jgi:hypothetical protein